MKNESNYNSPDQEAVMKFAQEHDQEELEKVEDEKIKLETLYAERQLEVAEKAERMQEKISQKELELEQVFSELEKLRCELDAKQEKSLSKLFNYLAIRSLREEIGVKEVKAKDMQDELAGLSTLYKDLEKEAKSKFEINKAEEMVVEFYSEQAEKLSAHEKEKQVRDVINISRKHNTVLTHSFLSWKGHGQVSVMNRGVGWKDMLHATIALEPHISTASVRLETGDDKPKDQAFFSMGVLLKGGEVTNATPGDAGSTVHGGERHYSRSSDDMEEDLDNAINKEDNFNNEILVRSPKVAALFFNSDIMSRLSESENFTEHGNKKIIDEILEEGQRLGMPVYMRDLNSGNYFLATGIKRKMVVGEDFNEVEVAEVQHSDEPANIQDILSSDFEFDEKQQDKMKKEILGKDLFNEGVL